jgi:hypothetical protein
MGRATLKNRRDPDARSVRAVSRMLVDCIWKDARHTR